MFYSIYKNYHYVTRRHQVHTRQFAISSYNNQPEKCSIENIAPIKTSNLLLKQISLDNLRNKFLKFFKESHGHPIIAPSSVYPKRNEGSYFINSGINQFKSRILLPSSSTSVENSKFYSLKSAVNTQPCIRIGGKYNDLNDVGYDSTHLTSFEMAGNWSFGSYGKREACTLMWKFLVDTLQIPKEALYITYFQGDRSLNLPADLETRDLWLEIGVPDTRLMAFGVKDNYWRAGSRSGGSLCGPSTEIHFDVNNFNQIMAGGKPSCARCQVNGDTILEGVVEIWNCVFIEKKCESENLNGKSMQDIPMQVIDTGMGLERVYAVLNGSVSIYESPHFVGLIRNLFEDNTIGYSGKYYTKNQIVANDEALKCDIGSRIVVDHFRTIATAFYDGLLPGRQELSLKVRQLIQRATRAAVMGVYSREPQSDQTKIVDHLVTNVFSNISKYHIEYTQSVLEKVDIRGPNARSLQPLIGLDHQKEILFTEMTSHCSRMHQIEEAFLKAVKSSTFLSAEEIQSLVSSKKFGTMLSLDSLELLAKWYGINLDLDALSTHKSMTRGVPLNDGNRYLPHQLNETPVTDDSPKYYSSIKSAEESKFSSSVPQVECSPIHVLTKRGQNLEIYPYVAMEEESVFYLITDRTNHYATAGGQDSDQGRIYGTLQDYLADIVEVVKMKRNPNDHGLVIHKCIWKSKSIQRLPERIVLDIDQERRNNLTMHHTGQHLFNYVISNLLEKSGSRLTSIKSLIMPNYFIHVAPVILPRSDDSKRSFVEFIKKVEMRCKSLIQACHPVTCSIIQMTDLEANSDIVRYPNEEYSHEELRLITLRKDNSELIKELCGGTHLPTLSPLEDVLVLNVENLNNVVKTFRVVVGKEAVRIRNYSREIHRQLEDRVKESQSILDPSERITSYNHLISHIKSLLSTSENLSYICRFDLGQVMESLLKESIGLKAKTTPRDKTKLQQIKDLIMANRKLSTEELVIIDSFDKNMRFSDIKKALASLEEDRVNVLVKSEKALLMVPKNLVANRLHENMMNLSGVEVESTPQGNLYSFRIDKKSSQIKDLIKSFL